MSTKREGWLVYAAVVMFIVAGVHAVWAINLWTGAAWLADISNGILSGQGWLWGVFDAVIAALFVFAGGSVLQGKRFGRWVAVGAASVSIIRWFYWMVFAPFLSLTVIAMMFLVLYGVLVTWGADDSA